MKSDWILFLSTFAVIFIAELPDKTALATLMLATRNRALGVFIGVCLAFVVQNAVAVLGGRLFGLIPHIYVEVVAALLFFAFAWQMYRQEAAPPAATTVAPPDETLAGASGALHSRGTASGSSRPLSGVILSSFTVIFIAEWGDLTQLATVTLVAQYRRPLVIFIAATLALWSVTAVAILVGRKMAEKINPRFLQRTAAGVFLLVGVVILGKAVFSLR